jgi:hypothetical protein
MGSGIATVWEPVDGMTVPCADISVKYDPVGHITAVMHFSHVRGGEPRDLELKFSGAIAQTWESENFGLSQIPDQLPKCPDGPWAKWTFPTLIIESSSWLSAHLARNPVAAEGLVHFALVAMNDLVSVLALPSVDAKWINP